MQEKTVAYDFPVKVVIVQAVFMVVLILYMFYRLFGAEHIPMGTLIESAIVGYSREELALHDGREGRDAWVSVRGGIYNVTSDPRFTYDPKTAHVEHGKRDHHILDPKHMASCWPLFPGRVVDRALGLEDCTHDILEKEDDIDGLDLRQRARIKHHALGLRHAHRWVGFLNDAIDAAQDYSDYNEHGPIGDDDDGSGDRRDRDDHDDDEE